MNAPAEETARALSALWETAQTLPAHALEDGWRGLCEEFTRLLRADGCYAILFSRQEGGFFHGWMPVAALDSGDGAELRDQINQRWLADPRCTADEAAARIFATSGTPRAFRTWDLAPTQEQMDASPSRQLIAEFGVVDRMMVGCPVDDCTEVHFGVDRLQGEEFTPAERDLAVLAVSGLRRAGRWIALAHGLAPGGALTPREQSVLGFLLTGRSEKQIADEIGLARSSTHQVVVSIYRKFRVNSRPELMALWLG